MHKNFLIFLAIVFVGCSTSPEYRENVKGIIEYELDDSLYKLTTQHLACYICETGTTPTSVSQLDSYQAKTPECKEIFIGKPFDFLDPNVATYNIEAREWKDRVVLDFKPSKGSQRGLVQSMSMPVLHSEMSCAYNKSINFAPTAPDSQSVASAAGY
jgi:hypothetical protein